MSSAVTLATARKIAADIKLHHSIFALPFALLAAFMAAAPAGASIDWTRFGGQLALIVLAMVLARTVAMLANRILDRHIDRENPRTAGRAIPSGGVTTSAALTALVGGAAAFLAVCLAFGLLYGNWWPSILGIPVLGWLTVYPLLKRISWLCHLYLGSSLALSPPAAALAVDPGAVTAQPALWLVAAMVMCWVAGFDIIYALQDVEVDRRQGWHSVPARFGVTGGLWASRGLHAIAVLCLAAAGRLDPRFGAIFASGVILVAVVLALEQLTVARWGTSRVTLAFFTLNGVVSCILGLLGIIDVLI